MTSVNFSHPAFALFQKLFALSTAPGEISIQQLNAWAEKADPRPCSALDAPIHFIAAPKQRIPALQYEQLIYTKGEVVTRENNWHDLFNALVWVAFPRTKAVLNVGHCLAGPLLEGGRRGQRRDALTMFDEAGIAVIATKPWIASLIAAKRWTELFWERREELTQVARFFVIGHGLYEKILRPFPQLAGPTLTLEVAQDDLSLPLSQFIPHLDLKLSAILADTNKITRPRDLPPLPIAGIPGWFPGNQEAEFYADKDVFRPMA